ncbi:MAG: 4Fe-4S cluster-binding domain-containing protein [Lachnospiraceae bacterium]|nr:4Fe-4S cluster-binding domain-containing protein [Lachnospiraceae bacterium]
MEEIVKQREKCHLINELPHIYELEDMMEFCKKYECLYIYGRGIQQEYLLKYFDLCGVKIQGYVVTKKKETDEEDFCYRRMPVYEFCNIKDKESTGVILALSDKYFHQIIPMFRKYGFSDYFAMTEYNKRAIAGQVRPRKREELAFEVSLADHCNLSCQMCDHYSQLSEEWLVDMGQFERDMIRMGEIFEHKLAYITLLGGEPTLHPNIIDCMRITREQFPEAEIIVLTNGVLLLALENGKQGNFWKACKDYNIHITVTIYPIHLDYVAIEKKAEEYGVILTMSSNIHANKLTKVVKISDKHTMDLNGKVDKFYCINCLYFNKFNALKDGKLYMCPIAAHSNIFNSHFKQNLETKKEDYLDIYQVDSWKEIAEFSSNYVPFCRYCDLKHWGHHSEWKSSTKKIEEYI